MVRTEPIKVNRAAIEDEATTTELVSYWDGLNLIYVRVIYLRSKYVDEWRSRIFATKARVTHEKEVIIPKHLKVLWEFPSYLTLYFALTLHFFMMS